MEDNKDSKKIYKWDEEESPQDLKKAGQEERKISKKVLKRQIREEEKLRRKQILEENKKSKLTKKGKVFIIAGSAVIILGLLFWILFGYFGIGIDLTRALAKTENLKVTEKEVSDYIDVLKSRNSESVPAKDDPQYDVLRANILDSMILQKLIMDYGAKNSFMVTDKELDDELAALKSNYETEEAFQMALSDSKVSLEYLRSQIRDQLLGEKIFEKVTEDVSVNEQEIKQYYEDNKDTAFTVPEQIKVSHILIKFVVPEGQELNDEIKASAKEEITEIENMINNGEDFEKLAKQYSQDDESRENGGDIGYISKGQTIAEFEDIAFSLEVGEISTPVETVYGYHLIKITDKQESYVKSFEEVKETIDSQLLNNKQSEVWDGFLMSLVKKANIRYTTDLKGSLLDIDKEESGQDNETQTDGSSESGSSESNDAE